ncbi:MAG: antibiotic biosynthesis monooxygenase [Alphaproteobacteria bacterium]|nr:MAG: antibiotic biosynthesis monooxygenase [Alphaproteobacteria bacterium]
MISFVAKLTVRPDKIATFERLQKELKSLTHANEPDTLVYEVMRSHDDPASYLVIATFTDRAAFELHQATDFHERLVPPIMACLAKEMELRFYDSLA